MRVRIETDLSWANTHVWDDESGEELRDVGHIALWATGYPQDRWICRLTRYVGPEQQWSSGRTTLSDVDVMEFTLIPPKEA